MAEIEARAAHNVLEACAQTDTIEKVVFTSSVTAVIWNESRTGSDLDEKNWTDINFCKKFKVLKHNIYLQSCLVVGHKLILGIAIFGAVMACTVENVGGKVSLGTGNGPRHKHGDHQWRIVDDA